MFIAPGIRPFLRPVAMRSVIVVVANAAASAQSIEDQAGRTNPCTGQQGNRTTNRMAWRFPGPNNDAHGLDMRHHQQSVTDCEYRAHCRSLLDQKVAQPRRLADQRKDRPESQLDWARVVPLQARKVALLLQ